jgi:hypothetical protein
VLRPAELSQLGQNSRPRATSQQLEPARGRALSDPVASEWPLLPPPLSAAARPPTYNREVASSKTVADFAGARGSMPSRKNPGPIGQRLARVLLEQSNSRTVSKLAGVVTLASSRAGALELHQLRVAPASRWFLPSGESGAINRLAGHVAERAALHENRKPQGRVRRSRARDATRRHRTHQEGQVVWPTNGFSIAKKGGRSFRPPVPRQDAGGSAIERSVSPPRNH